MANTSTLLIFTLVSISFGFLHAAERSCSSLKAPRNGMMFGIPGEGPIEPGRKLTVCSEAPINPGTLCSFKCNQGFVMEGPKNLTCGTDYLWDDDPPTCEGLCTDLNPPGNGSYEGKCNSTVKVYDTCSFKCSRGFVRKGAKRLVCSPNLRWSDDSPKCVNTCPAVSVAGAERLEGKCDGSAKAGDKCTISCSKDSVLRGDGDLVCKQDFEWNSTFPTCVSSCEAVSVPGAESLEGKCDGSAKAGDRCTVSCPKGYVLEGAKELVCREDLEWNRPFPTCERTCSLLEPPRNGKMIGMCWAGPVKPGTVCSFSCSPGYVMEGPDRLKCDSDYEWNNHPPTCEGVCPALKAPKYGSYEGKCDGKAKVHESCTFNCWPGFALKGAKVLACSSNFQWTDDPPECVDTCQRINTWEFARVEGDCWSKIKINQTCKFFCRDYQKLVGHKEITCGENFTWSGTIPKCESTECNKEEPTTTKSWHYYCSTLKRKCTEPRDGQALTECGPCKSGFKEDSALAGNPNGTCIVKTECEEVKPGTRTWTQHCSSLNRVCNEPETYGSTAECGQCLDKYVEDATQTGSSDRACAAPALKGCMQPFRPSQPEGPTWAQHCAEQNKECNSVTGPSCDDCLWGFRPGRRLTDPCVSGGAAIASWFLTVFLVPGLVTILNRF